MGKQSIFFLSLIIVLVSSCHNSRDADLLTANERHWLENNKQELLLAPEANYPPFSFVDEQGRFCGISSDFISLLEQKLDVDFRIAPPNNLAYLLAQIKMGEIEMLTSLAKTPRRTDFLLFSEPYFKVPVYIFCRNTSVDLITLDDLSGKKVGLGNEYGVHEFLKKEYNFLNIFPQNDDHTSLQMLSVGELDAVVLDIASASWLIHQNGISNLKIVGKVDYSYELRLAVRKDLPMLKTILNKAIVDVSNTERALINKEWIKVEIPSFWTRYLLPILFVSLLVVAMVVMALIWNFTLKKTIKARTEALYKSDALLRNIVENNPDLIWMKNADGAYVTCNQRLADVVGASVGEIIGKTDFDLFDKNVASSYVQTDKEALSAGKAVINEDDVVFGSDGHREVLETTKTPIYDEKGELIGVFGIARNISKRKETERELMDYRGHLEELVAQRTAQFQASVEEIEQLVYVISHDLRAPIRHTQGFVRMLKKSIGHASQASQDYMVKIEESSGKMGLMIDDLLAFAHLNRIPVKKAKVELSHIVNKCLKFFEDEIKDRGLQIQISNLAVVEGDASLLQLVFKNFRGQ
jgi:two-component system, sensor histidine kinase and response regulator